MKQLFITTTLAFITTVAVADVISPPYASDIAEDTSWKILNINPDTRGWESSDDYFDFKGSGHDSGMFYKYDRKNPADDWLISPAIALSGGKEYKVIFLANPTSDMENFRLTMATDESVASLSAPESVLYEYDGARTGWQKISKVVRPDADITVHFGIHAYSPEDLNYIYVTGFEVKENIFAPSPVSGLKVEPDADGAVSAIVSWTLPTLDTDNSPIPEDATFDKVTIRRDGELIIELGGDCTAFTDNEEKGLTAGKHTYSVTVTVNGVESASAEITSGYIGPIATKALPWTAGVADMDQDTFASEYLVIKGPRSGVKASNGWMLKGGTIDFYPGSTWINEDDWLVLPKMNFSKPGVYCLRASASYDGSDPRIEVRIGASRDIDALSSSVGSFTEIYEMQSDFSVTFNVETSGEYYLALYANREDISSSRRIRFYEFTVEPSVIRPINVTDLNAEVENDKVNLSWTVPSIDNSGGTVASLDKLELYRDGEAIETFVEPAGGVSMSHVDTPSAGVHTYMIRVYLNNLQPEKEPMIVSTGWVGDALQQLPYSLDFTQSPDLDIVKALWMLVNRDNDSYKWSVGSSAFTLKLDADGGSEDDLLLSPPFNFEPGVYDITFNAKGGENGFPIHIGLVDENDSNYELNYSTVTTLNGKNSYAEYKVELTIDDPERARLAIATDPTYEYDWDPYNVMISSVAITSRPSETVSIPYEPDCYNDFIIVNANNDYEMDGVTPTTWNIAENSLSIDSPFEGTDDWAISPIIELETGKYYELSLSHDIEEGFVELYMGHRQTPDQMSDLIDELRGASDFIYKFCATDNMAIALHAPQSGAIANVNAIALRNASDNTEIQEIRFDNSVNEPIYYDLNGIRIEKPVKKGIYLVQRAGQAIQKLLIK